jgi:hypothetical protein
MKSYRRLGEVVAATLLLLAPAMWNGFPFLQYDSGGYLARWFEGMLLLPVILLLGRGEYGDLRLLAATVAVALLANAVVCGALSNPHDRYGARLAWIATFAVVLVPMRYAVTRPSTAVNASSG